MDHETLEEKFIVTTPARLAISNIRGSVEIRAGEENTISVTAVKDLNSGDANRTGVVMTQEEGGGVHVETIFREARILGSLFGTQRPCKVAYMIWVPRACEVRVNCVSSHALVEGVEGSFSLETVSGDLTLGSLAGSLWVKTVSGNIEGENLVGTLKLDTVSGRVRIVGADLPSIEAHSVSGEQYFQTPLGAGPYTFQTVSGNVVLKVPGEAHCSLQAQRVSGRINSDLPVTHRQGQYGYEYLEIGGGGVPLKYYTTSGNFDILAAERIR